MFRTALVQSSNGTVSFVEAEQLEREAGATNEIHIFVDHKYICCLSPLHVSVSSAICRETTLIATGRWSSFLWGEGGWGGLKSCNATVLPSCAINGNRVSLKMKYFEVNYSAVVPGYIFNFEPHMEGLNKAGVLIMV